MGWRMGESCSSCGGARDRGGQRFCLECHARYMRGWRKTHRLTPEQARKDNCRSYAGVYLRRGKLVRAPCERCGDEKSQMHHPDYSQPLLVRWLCRPCHLAEHRAHVEHSEKAALNHGT